MKSKKINRANSSMAVSKQKPTTKKNKKAKVKKVMDEWKHGELKTNAGKPVEDQKQAIAIALSESGQSYKNKGKGKRKK